MNHQIKNNWINILGIIFLFTAFLYFLKMIVDSGLFPPEARAASGLIIGTSALFTGLTFFKKGKIHLAEIVSGLGVAMVYATLAYVSFNDSIQWSPNAMLICMVATSIITGFVAVKFNMRVLYNLSTLGGLITPLILKATASQNFMLFIYLLIINVAALYVSTIKKWQELKVISFVSTLTIYCTYYLLFDPVQWLRPFFYIASFFLVYMIAMAITAFNKKQQEFGIDQYLGLLNAINFVFWSNYIFNDFCIPHTLPMIIVGVFFISTGVLLFYTKNKLLTITNATYLGLGMIVMAIACSDTGLILKGGMNYVINSSIWLILIVTAFLLGKHSREQNILYGTYIGFVLLSVYWYSVAWNVEWVNIFGIKYIPFVNIGAFVWMGLAFLGFCFSRFELSNTEDKSSMDKKKLSTSLALVSHIIIGGLLTVQISNLWQAYKIEYLKIDLAMSICWMTYALIIFLWSNYSRNKLFKILGTIVLVCTSLKVFIWDLSGTATVQKVIFLIIIGVLTLIISKINHKTKEQQ